MWINIEIGLYWKWYGQTCPYCSTIFLGPKSWPFFGKNPKSFIGIAIVWIFTFWSFNFVTVLLLLVIKILNIGLYKGYFWYCVGIVLLYTNIYIRNSVSSKLLKHLKIKQFQCITLYYCTVPTHHLMIS